MTDAVGATIGYAVGIAISPIPIAAVILMLFTGRARSNSLAFSAAWIFGIALVTTVALLVPGLHSDQSEPSDTTGWIKLVLGVLLLAFGWRRWRSRPADGDEPDVPGWMDRIDELRPGAAFGLGFLLSAINPKNLLLAAAAGATIGAINDLSTAETVGTVAVFTAIAASTVIVPVAVYLIRGHKADAALDRAKSWLIENNAAVLGVLFIVFGVLLVGEAIQILG